MSNFKNLHRGSCLGLFVISGLWSCLNPHAIPVAAISVVGLIAYDVVCLLKEKHGKDHTVEINELKEQLATNTQYIKDMKDDVSVAKLANSFRRG